MISIRSRTAMSVIGLVLGMGLSPSLAFAGEQQATPPAEQANAPEDDPNRVVCRRMPVTGSISRVKVCKTAAQWQQEARGVDARKGESLNSTRGGVQQGG